MSSDLGAVMFKVFAVAVLAFLISTQAHAVCTQADLKGLWRFMFDTGIATSQTPSRSLISSCLLTIKADGAIVPRKCQTVYGSTDEGGIVIASSNRKFLMKPNCTVVIGGDIVYLNDFELKFGNSFWFFNGADLSISENKQMMLGWLSLQGTPVFAVTALKRATP
jgi:hypothetical protein